MNEDFIVPTPGNTAEALRDLANHVETTDIARGVFIGLSRGREGIMYSPSICAINMNEDEIISLLESAKFLIMSQIFVKRDEEEENEF